jgi:3-dehydroquinate dehydratase/shikimate dehydrogenase
MTYLIVPISASNIEQARKQIKAARLASAEILELRTDYLTRLNTSVLKLLIEDVKQTKLPVVVTCRDKRQGGASEYPLQLRSQILAEAVAAGADFIDCEYENFLIPEIQEKLKTALSQAAGCRLILSAHNFESRFEDINKLYSDVLAVFPDAIPKLVYTASHIADCFDAFDLLNKKDCDAVIFCMGEAGLLSRIIAKKLGCFYTFASIDDKSATAPGQLTIEQMKKFYRFDSIDAQTQFFGVIGCPVGHSLSPAIFNGAFEKAGMNKIYLPLLVDDGKAGFDSFMSNVLARPWLGFRGFSVTIPHKQNALNFVRQNQGFVEPLAAKIGAVNTVVIGPDGNLSAYNTDYAGALDAITSGLHINRDDFKGKSVAVIGAGGVARAIVAGLSDVGAKITIYNRTVQRGEKLAADFNCVFAPLNDLSNLKAELLINCTSIGMYPDTDATPVPKEYISKDMTVFDTVYNPAQTLLLKQAKEKGAQTIDGLSMFVNQAAAQFKLFTGKTADIELMRKTVSENLFA